MKPHSITMFDRIFFASLILGLLGYFLTYDVVAAQLTADPAMAAIGITPLPFIIVTGAIGFGINLLLWFFISKGRSAVAKWIFTVLVVLGLASLPFSLGDLPVLVIANSLVAAVLQVAMLYFLFRPESKPWFDKTKGRADPSV
ncbi:MAG: hypothetical protein WBA51_00355, partial [Erythrobacter sp.]